MSDVVIVGACIAGAIVGAGGLVRLGLQEAATRLGEHLGGAFGASAEYEKAYIPWDELEMKMLQEHPELYAKDELVFEHEIEGVDET